MLVSERKIEQIKGDLKHGRTYAWITEHRAVSCGTVKKVKDGYSAFSKDVSGTKMHSDAKRRAIMRDVKYGMKQCLAAKKHGVSASFVSIVVHSDGRAHASGS
jgi:hypothetical protein